MRHEARKGLLPVIVHYVLRSVIFLESKVGKGVNVVGTLDQNTVLGLDSLENGFAIDRFF
jgi:hypothetical protein